MDDAAAFESNKKPFVKLVKYYGKAAKVFFQALSVPKCVIVPTVGKWKAKKMKKFIKENKSSGDFIPKVIIEGEQMKGAVEAKYLGTIISASGTCKEEISKRLSKAKQRFYGLGRMVFKGKYPLKLKVKLFVVLVLSTLFYDCGNWTTNDSDYSKLESFLHKSILYMLGKRYKDKISMVKARKLVDLLMAETQVRGKRLMWYGKVMKMGRYRLVKQILEREIGKRKRQTKLWIECVLEDIYVFKINMNRQYFNSSPATVGLWRRAVKDGQDYFESLSEEEKQVRKTEARRRTEIRRKVEEDKWKAANKERSAQRKREINEEKAAKAQRKLERIKKKEEKAAEEKERKLMILKENARKASWIKMYGKKIYNKYTCKVCSEVGNAYPYEMCPHAKQMPL